MKKQPHSILLQAPWLALNGPHEAFAYKYGCACVYKEGYCNYGGVSEYTEKAYRDLASIVRPGRYVVILGTEDPFEYPEWKPIGKFTGYGMVLEKPINVSDLDYEKLSKSDVPDMIELAKITGLSSEFLPSAIEIGNFFGIRDEGSLVAMAGERLKLEGYTEVSGVCTHPDCRRRGYGRGLSALVSKRIQERGDIPFLQVFEENVGAIRIYEKMGFKKIIQGYHDVLLRTEVNP